MPPFTFPTLARVAASAIAAASAVALLPAAAGAAPLSDADLLAAIQQQAPDTTAITDVVAGPGVGRLAIRTRAAADGDPTAHDELWSADADGTQLTPLRRSTGSAAAFTTIGPVRWSEDGVFLAYVSANSAAKISSAAHVVTFNADGSPTDRSLGNLSDAPQFTADGRYVTFVRQDSALQQATGAYDLASGALLSPARIDYVAPDGTTTAPSWYAPECARAAEAGWVSSLSGGRWMERALASPDPGCRFGANVNDPGAPAPETVNADDPVVPAPDTGNADDAPSSITTQVAGTDLVTIAERSVATAGPSVTIGSSAKGLSRAIRRGLRVQVSVAGAQRLQAYVIAQRPAGEGLLAAATSTRTTFTLGRLTVRRPASRTHTLAIPLTRAARAALPHFAKLTVTVRIVATDSAGRRAVAERQVALSDL
ncbi:MAG: hypothetical protein QM679_13060 [Patulibacter sp.]